MIGIRRPTPYDQIVSDLQEWGKWSRDCVIGLGFKSRTIEHQLMSGEVFGDGNSKTRRMDGGTSIRENPVAERMDIWIRLLSKKCPKECEVLKMTYIMQWSNRKIAEKASISRSQALKLKTRGITLLLGMEASQAKSRPPA